MLFVGKMVACIFEEAHESVTNRKSGVGLVRFYVTYLKERTMSLDHSGPKRLTIYLNEEVWGKLQRLNNYYGSWFRDGNGVRYQSVKHHF